MKNYTDKVERRGGSHMKYCRQTKSIREERERESYGICVFVAWEAIR